jgi:hypothetical protein
MSTRRREVGPSETGLAGVAGGVSAVAWGGAVAVAPTGSVPPSFVFAAGYLSAALGAFACVGLLAALAGDGLPRLARVGLASVVAGLVVLAVAAVAGVAAPATATVFVTPGVVATLVGFVSTAAAGWRGGVLARWHVAVVGVGAALFLLFRPAGPPAALVVPLGVGWAVVGDALRRRG